MGIRLYNLESGREEADMVGSVLDCGISTANTLELPQSSTFTIDMRLDGLVLDCGISTTNTLEMLQSCTSAIDMRPDDSP